MVEHVLCMITCKIKAGQHAGVYQGNNPYWFEGIALSAILDAIYQESIIERRVSNCYIRYQK